MIKYKMYEVYHYTNGDKHWFYGGKRHREDGPAIEFFSGGKEWWLNNQRHREDGAACEYSDGVKFWYLNDVRYTEEEYHNKQNKVPSCAGKVVSVDGRKYKLEEV